MAQTIIEVDCTDQVLRTTRAPRVASGGVNENKVVFVFCPLWDGFTKTAVFRFGKGEPVEANIAEDNSCIIPSEVTAKPGNLFFGVCGVNDKGTRRTSTVIKYNITQGAITPE